MCFFSGYRMSFEPLPYWPGEVEVVTEGKAGHGLFKPAFLVTGLALSLTGT